MKEIHYWMMFPACRPVCIFGAVFSWASFSLSVMSPSVGVMMFTYGIMGGLGLGLIYLPAIVSVGFYFERRRALATGEKQIYNQKLKMTKIYVSRYLGVRLRGRGLRDGSPSQVAGQHLRLGGQKECREFKYWWISVTRLQSSCSREYASAAYFSGDW